MNVRAQESSDWLNSHSSSAELSVQGELEKLASHMLGEVSANNIITLMTNVIELLNDALQVASIDSELIGDNTLADEVTNNCFLQ